MNNLPDRFQTRRGHVVDNFHGTKVADPYRWLEDDNCPEVQEWMERQNEDFQSYITAHPIRDELKSRLADIWDYARCTVPHCVNGLYYKWHNNGLQNQFVLYRSTSPHALGDVIFDPNTLSEDGTVAVSSKEFSPKGRYLAYGLSSKGSDWQTLHILDLHTLETLPDVLEHLRFTTPCWLPDESGFFYSCFPPPSTEEVLKTNATNMMVRLHLLGQAQGEDKLIHKDDDNPTWNFNLTADEDNKWAFMSIWYGTLPKNHLYFRPLEKLDAPWIPIADNFDDGWEVIGVVDDIVYLKTQQSAPFGKVMCAKLSETGVGELQTVVADRGEMLEHVMIVNNQLLCVVLHHATHQLMVHELDGTFAGEIKMPTIGSVVGYFAKQRDKEMFIQVSNTLYPNTVLRHSFDTQQMETVFEPQIDFAFDDYEMVQKFYTSKDGTQIPMFITQRKGLALDGSHPTLLYGYGGFDVSMTPVFSAPNLAWLEKGGVYAVACIRGGSEYGEAWHRAGMLESKQNVFDDFIAGAEFLISEKYTCTSKLSIYGGSNGGLLTGACLTQRPDLFGAVAVAVPVLDMLRYHTFTVGRYWTGEYGCADNPEEFPFMYKYSPLHNVKMNTVYPPTLILTADTDDRVVPSQARKFAATLQAADGGTNPICIRIEKSAGHGAGKPISKLIEERADLFTFLLVNLV